jgi:hypothetical protein
MSVTIDWLASGEDGYLLDDARSKYAVKDLGNHGYLVLNWDDKEFFLKFAVLTVGLDLQFYGEGPTGNLRECRHTYWGEDGYLFYPDGKVITAAFKELSKYFDDLYESKEEA